MNQADKNTLANLRSRIDAGEQLNPTLLARYQDLVAQEAREQGLASAVADAVNSKLFELAQDLEEIIATRTMSGSSAESVRYRDNFGVIFETLRRRTPQERLEYRQRRAARRAQAGNVEGDS